MSDEVIEPNPIDQNAISKWRLITSSWGYPLRSIVRKVGGKSLEERRQILIKLLPPYYQLGKNEPSFFRILTSTLNSSDEELKDIIDSFPEEEEKPILVKAGESFKPFEKVKSLGVDGSIWSRHGVLELLSYIEFQEIDGTIQARSLMSAPDNLILLVNLFPFSPADFRELANLEVLVPYQSKFFTAFFNEGNLDLERELFRARPQYALWNGTTSIIKLITAIDEGIKKPVAFPRDLEEMRSLSFIFTQKSKNLEVKTADG